MEQLAEKLEEFCMRKFINVHQHKLCQNTVNQRKITAFLNFDADQIAIIMDPPDNFSRCSKMYEYIEKTTEAPRFLEALDKTGNEHMIKFIESVLIDSQLKRGIWFNIPHEIDSFCGREDFLTKLHDQLKPQDGSATEVTVLSQVKIVSGLGGIGKTETARKYISQYFEFYNNFIWIDAETENSMTNSFFKLAEEIKIPIKNSEGKSRAIKEILKEIYNKICDGGKSNLIVFDNAEDYQSCQHFLPILAHPKMKKPMILATSRNQDWISPTGKIHVLPLDKMTDNESLEFVLKQLEIPESEIPEFREESKEFIELIGGLPLALQQAVAFIKQQKEERKFLGTPYKMSDYVQEFKSSMKKFLSFPPLSVSSATVFVTWNVTFEKIQKLENGESAVKILEILSFLYADKIPSTFLHDLVPEIKDAQFSGGLKLLEKYSLIKMNVRDFCLSVHRQLQLVILQYLNECNDVSNVVMNIVDKCEVVLDKILLSKSGEIFLNLHQIVNNQYNLIPETTKFLDFMGGFGGMLSKASRYSESLDVLKKVYSKKRDLLGENHEATLKTQNNIALQLSKLGKYDESLTLYQEVVKKRENHPDLGVDHPSTLITKHSIASVLRMQGKYEESLELYQQVLAQQNKIQGEDHPKTLSTQNSIALVYSELGDFSQALHLYQKVEEKCIEVLGPDHPDVLSTKHNKASVLFEMGKFEEASKIFKENYEQQKKALGENHLDTIRTLEFIGTALQQEEKFPEALDIYKRVHEIRKANLGEDHPQTIVTKHAMSDLLRHQKKYEESLELLEEALVQEIKIHGENHPTTLQTQNTIALNHSNLGNFSKALALYEQVEKKCIKVLGPDHRDVLVTKHNIAAVFFEMGKFQEASKIFGEVYDSRKETLGENHSDTIQTLGWIALVLERQEKFTEALDMWKKLYEIRKTNLGEDHPQTTPIKSRIVIVEERLREKGSLCTTLSQSQVG